MAKLSDEVTDEPSDWFDINESDWLPPTKSTKKLKLYADASVPFPIIKELRDAKIPVKAAVEDGFSSRGDPAIINAARKRGRVLLTLDGDFWDDKKFPLHQAHGVVFVDVPPHDIKGILDAIGLLCVCFAKNYPLNWWRSMKAKCTAHNFTLKIHTWEGRNVSYELKLSGSGQLLAKELS